MPWLFLANESASERTATGMETNLQRPQRLFAQPVRYEIPEFQRRYVWKQEEQWEPLWADVEELARLIMDKLHVEAHFMGAVVLQQMQSPTATIERRIVVDGQQRLTTLQLLIDAIKAELEVQGHTSPAERLSALVANGDAFRDGESDHAFKVWPTLVDRAAFRQAMGNDQSAKADAESLIAEAHSYFRSQTAQWIARFNGESGNSASAADALEAAVSRHLQLVVIDLGEADDPHIIFETLNARGTALLQSDMVKNKILHETGAETGGDERETGKDVEGVWPFDQDKWWTQDVGRGLQRRPRVDVYLNHWLTLRNKAETKPYGEFRGFVNYADARKLEGGTIHQIVRDLQNLGETYRDVEEIRQTAITRYLERREAMNIGVDMPLLLWLLSADLPPAGLMNCVNAIESFLVRRLVCGYSARSYGELFVGLIRKLESASVNDADSVLVAYLAGQAAQATFWPGDDELRERFLTAPLYRILTRGRLRMVLEGIESELRTNKSETREVPKNLHIEHVMPQNWLPHWPVSAKLTENEKAVNERERAIHTIGNLTLVNGPLNSSLSNAAWDDKKKTLRRHSVLVLNGRLVEKYNDGWDEAGIRKRANWLHKRAVKIWPHAAQLHCS